MISIIVPCYNAEAYLKECFESIKKQTYTDFEVIFVDDGSTDSTLEILEDFKKNNQDIALTLYHEPKNQGVSVARNTGLKLAKGEYITFVDADDRIDPKFLEVLVYGLKFGDMSVVGIGGNGFGDGSTPYEGLITKEKFIYEFWLTKHLWGSCDNKLYAKEVIVNHDITFDPTLKIMEDMFFNLLYCQYIETIYVSDQKLYYYRKNNTSTMQRKFSATNMTVITTFHKMLALPLSYTDKQIIELHQVNSLLWLLRILYKANDQGIDDRYEKTIIQEIDSSNTKLFLKKGWKKGPARYLTFLLYQIHPKCYKCSTKLLYKFKGR